MSGGGAVIWQGPSQLDGAPVVAIATSLRGATSRGHANTKTGDVVQTWIMRSDVRPAEALRTGDDFSVCGTCPLRPQRENGTGRGCYVHIGHVANVFKAWRAGTYLRDCKPENLEGRVVRVGSYGDPTAIPLAVWRRVLAYAEGWVGYTHQWREVSREWASLLMASCDRPEERAEAAAAGYRSFRTRLEGEPLLEGELACPASEEAGRRTTCLDCRLCDGVQYHRDRRRDVAIIAHGPSADYGYRAARAALRVLA